MQISFQGIKNPGAYTHKQELTTIVKTNYQNFIFPKGRTMNFNCELTNENGNELDDFKYILKAYPNNQNKNAINIGYDWFINPNDGKKMRLYSINHNILDINDITFDVFNKVFKLLNKVANMPRENITVDNAYLSGNEAMSAFSNYFFSEPQKSMYQILDDAHQRDNIKAIAGLMAKKFARALSEYILS